MLVLEPRTCDSYIQPRGLFLHAQICGGVVAVFTRKRDANVIVKKVVSVRLAHLIAEVSYGREGGKALWYLHSTRPSW